MLTASDPPLMPAPGSTAGSTAKLPPAMAIGSMPLLAPPGSTARLPPPGFTAAAVPRGYEALPIPTTATVGIEAAVSGVVP